MNTAAHPVAPEEVMAFLDGELSPEQAQTVSAHVEHCEECASIAAAFQGESKTFSDWHIQPAPDRLTKRVGESASKIRSGTDVQHRSAFVRLSFWSWKKWAFAVGALGVTCLLMLAIAIPNLMRARMSAKEGSLPLNGRQFTSLTPLASPQGVADSNGNFESAGHHAATSFSLDGQPQSEDSGNGALGKLATKAGDDVAEHQESEYSKAPMIARTVSLSLVVKNFAAARANLDVILARHHGYAADLTANTTENSPKSLEASLRIPAPELEAAIADLKALGRVERETRSGEEVTQQHADLVARLKNSRETERQLQTILQQRTGKVKEVLEVEEEIARVRGEIEQMEAEQKSLEHRVDFATVSLSLAEEYKAQLVPPAISVGTRVHNALVEGYRSASETLLGIVLFFAEYTLTLLIWAAILVLPALLLWRRFRRSLAAV